MKEVTIRIERIWNGLLVYFFTGGPGSVPERTVFATDMGQVCTIITTYALEKNL